MITRPDPTILAETLASNRERLMRIAASIQVAIAKSEVKK